MIVKFVYETTACLKGEFLVDGNSVLEQFGTMRPSILGYIITSL